MPSLEDEEKEEEEYEKEDADYLDEQKNSNEYEDHEGENIAPTGETAGLTENIFVCSKCKAKKVIKEAEMTEMMGPPVHCGMIMKQAAIVEEEIELPFKKGAKKKAKTAKLKPAEASAKKRKNR